MQLHISNNFICPLWYLLSVNRTIESKIIPKNIFLFTVYMMYTPRLFSLSNGIVILWNTQINRVLRFQMGILKQNPNLFVVLNTRFWRGNEGWAFLPILLKGALDEFSFLRGAGIKRIGGGGWEFTIKFSLKQEN